MLFFIRALTQKQKALMQAWAELEADVSGTVHGIKNTVDGMYEFYIIRFRNGAFIFS